MPKDLSLVLKLGDQAPPFDALTQDGTRLTLASLSGSRVVLYFYPKDNTPGCTKEACGFRDLWAEIRAAGAIVIGVSPDSAKSHGKFAGLFKLPFPLLADEDKRIATAYGVWGEKKFMGRTYQGVHRVSFLIGAEGRIDQIWTGVKPDAHPKQVLEALG